MGKKRKREESEERIQHKIRKLEEKLRKRRRIQISSSEDEYNSPRPFTPEEIGLAAPEEHAVTMPPPDTLPPTQTESTEQPLPVPQIATLSQPGNSTEETPVIELDDDTLQLLGEAPEPEMIFGNPIHKDIAARWNEILKKGLNKETKEKLLKDYPIPENCQKLVSPLLNPEAKAALTDNFTKRDVSLVSRQKHLGAAIAALTMSIDKLITNKDFQNLKSEILKPISDACRIMCDMHYYETETRKRFVISSINSELRETLVNSQTDKFLFGENMSDKLKAAKTVQRSGEVLKVTPKPTNQRVFSTPNTYTNTKSRGNFKTLHQRRPDAGRQQARPRMQQSYPRGRATARPAPPQAPPNYHPPPPPPANHRKQSRR